MLSVLPETLDLKNFSYLRSKLPLDTYYNEANGFFWYAYRRKKAYTCVQLTTTTCHIIHFEVNCEYKRQGVGTAFLYSISNRMKELGIKKIILDPKDEAAEMFWRHLGFKDSQGTQCALELNIG